MIGIILYLLLCMLWGAFVARMNWMLYSDLRDTLHVIYWSTLNTIIAPVSLAMAIIKGTTEIEEVLKERYGKTDKSYLDGSVMLRKEDIEKMR